MASKATKTKPKCEKLSVAEEDELVERMFLFVALRRWEMKHHEETDAEALMRRWDEFKAAFNNKDTVKAHAALEKIDRIINVQRQVHGSLIALFKAYNAVWAPLRKAKRKKKA